MQLRDGSEGAPGNSRAPSEIERLERRKLRFEARKFAIDTLVRMYLAQLEGTRSLRVGHVKLTFGLSLGALAGVLTVISALARFTENYPEWPEDRIPILLLVSGLGGLLAAAVTAISHYRTVVEGSADLLLRPYPGAELEFNGILSGTPEDETAYLDSLSAILSARTRDSRQHHPPSSVVLLLVLFGTTATGVALFML
ncbi:hypothetical protein [Amaricoccus sp. W119]|uniref:hypothetical protein n=1 Tax=Amaricoccus sp. W119 TaxID=3391833 RepID=UPI0039A6CF30